MDLVLAGLVLGLLGLAYWGTTRLEPHWSSKDGRRFTARVQVLYPDGTTSGWQEVRATVTGDDALMLTSRGLARRLMSSRIDGTWTLRARSPKPPRRRQIYLLDGSQQLALRLPASSRVVPVLDAIVADAPGL